MPAFLPGETQAQRSLVSYSPWGHKELDTIERSENACTRVELTLQGKKLYQGLCTRE